MQYFRRLLALSAWMLLALVGLAFLLRPQSLAAITVLPFWVWLGPGVLLSLPACRKRNGRVVLLLWLGLALAFTDELRGLVPRPPPAGRCVVLLNCAGRPSALAEALRPEPDLVLLSEVPPRFQAPAGYHAVIGPDTAILARSPLREPKIEPSWVQARTEDGLQVYSVRLVVGVLRADLWNPDCWREQAFNRATREESLQKAVFAPGPVLFGGDMNAPAGDGAFRPLRQAGLRDTFPRAGTGLGNTIENGLPVHRIDQLWTRELRPVRLETRATQSSDHRLVVAWFR